MRKLNAETTASTMTDITITSITLKPQSPGLLRVLDYLYENPLLRNQRCKHGLTQYPGRECCLYCSWLKTSGATSELWKIDPRIAVAAKSWLSLYKRMSFEQRDDFEKLQEESRLEPAVDFEKDEPITYIEYHSDDVHSPDEQTRIRALVLGGKVRFTKEAERYRNPIAQVLDRFDRDYRDLQARLLNKNCQERERIEFEYLASRMVVLENGLLLRVPKTLFRISPNNPMTMEMRVTYAKPDNGEPEIGEGSNKWLPLNEPTYTGLVQIATPTICASYLSDEGLRFQQWQFTHLARKGWSFLKHGSATESGRSEGGTARPGRAHTATMSIRQMERAWFDQHQQALRAIQANDGNLAGLVAFSPHSPNTQIAPRRCPHGWMEPLYCTICEPILHICKLHLFGKNGFDFFKKTGALFANAQRQSCVQCDLGRWNRTNVNREEHLFWTRIANLLLYDEPTRAQLDSIANLVSGRGGIVRRGIIPLYRKPVDNGACAVCAWAPVMYKPNDSDLNWLERNSEGQKFIVTSNSGFQTANIGREPQREEPPLAVKLFYRTWGANLLDLFLPALHHVIEIIKSDADLTAVNEAHLNFQRLRAEWWPSWLYFCQMQERFDPHLTLEDIAESQGVTTEVIRKYCQRYEDTVIQLVEGLGTKSNEPTDVPPSQE